MEQSLIPLLLFQCLLPQEGPAGHGLSVASQPGLVEVKNVPNNHCLQSNPTHIIVLCKLQQLGTSHKKMNIQKCLLNLFEPPSPPAGTPTAFPQVLPRTLRYVQDQKQMIYCMQVNHASYAGSVEASGLPETEIPSAPKRVVAAVTTANRQARQDSDLAAQVRSPQCMSRMVLLHKVHLITNLSSQC